MLLSAGKGNALCSLFFSFFFSIKNGERGASSLWRGYSRFKKEGVAQWLTLIVHGHGRLTV